MYYFLSNDSSFLFYPALGLHVSDIKDSVYFSFVAATTTGFGDIVPLGWFKVISVLEVIFGLLLLAVVTSKLVSIKQDAILVEVYELSFNERINRLRSSLLVFRQNLDRTISKIEDGSIKRREINNIYVYLSSFEDALKETFSLITRNEAHQFVKNIDAVNTQLIFNSILSSFEKVHELLSSMSEGKLEWRSDINVNFISDCLRVNEDLFVRLNTSTIILKQTLQDLNSRRSEIVSKIKEEIIGKSKESSQ
ncbi:two pore domain potassium channel family protein [archaeon]|nr:two pore domain potassium channel family protein [archaeon]